MNILVGEIYHDSIKPRLVIHVEGLLIHFADGTSSTYRKVQHWKKIGQLDLVGNA